MKLAGVPLLNHSRDAKTYKVLVSHSMEIGRMAWHSSKFIFLEISSNSVIKGGESENRSPGARMCVVYAVVNVVL